MCSKIISLKNTKSVTFNTIWLGLSMVSLALIPHLLISIHTLKTLMNTNFLCHTFDNFIFSNWNFTALYSVSSYFSKNRLIIENFNLSNITYIFARANNFVIPYYGATNLLFKNMTFNIMSFFLDMSS